MTDTYVTYHGSDGQVLELLQTFNMQISGGIYPNMDFNQSAYISKDTPIKVLCTKHNLNFNSRLKDIRSGKRVGCRECVKELRGEPTTPNYEQMCLSESAWVPLEKRVDSKTPIKHECLCCGDVQTFKPIKPSSYLKKCQGSIGDGKSELWYKHRNKNSPFLNEKRLQQIKKSKKKKSKHNFDTFLKEYSSVERISKFKGAMSKCFFHCSICNKTHERRCTDIRKSVTKNNTKGCRVCNFMNATPKSYYPVPTILYYIKVGSLYKIGITIHDVKTRYKDEKIDYKIIKTWSYKTGKKAYKKEQKILRKYRKYRYYGEFIFKKSGNTEVFTHDVLGLDNE